MPNKLPNFPSEPISVALPKTKTEISTLSRYVTGVAWIAMNDEPTWMEDRRRDIEQQMTVVMLADVFNLTVERVANDVLDVRKVTNHPDIRLMPR